MDLDELRDLATWRKGTHPGLLAILERYGEQSLSEPGAEPHWACESCGQPCRCSIPALPHVDCGLPEA